jgi:hypothetical protein
MNSNELKEFILWYWDNIDAKPYRISALEIAEDYLAFTNKEDEGEPGAWSGGFADNH